MSDPLHRLEVETLKEEIQSEKDKVVEVAGEAIRALAKAHTELQEAKAARDAAEAQVEELLRERAQGEWSRP